MEIMKLISIKLDTIALYSDRFPNILEPLGISRDDGKKLDGTKKLDMTLTLWICGKSLLWDVADTPAPSYSFKTRSVAVDGELIKHTHYISLKENNLFAPISFETLGCMRSDTRQYLNKLGKYLILNCQLLNRDHWIFYNKKSLCHSTWKSGFNTWNFW